MDLLKLPKEVFLEKANTMCKDTLMETLNISFIDFGKDFITAKMPVNSSVYQPDGVLHGGATAALAETVGSFAAHIFSNRKDIMVRGIEINSNHLKSVKTGHVYAKANFIHKGKTTQLIEIRVTDDEDRLVSISKLTTIILEKK